jgi:hypothetical protein
VGLADHRKQTEREKIEAICSGYRKGAVHGITVEAEAPGSRTTDPEFEKRMGMS